VALIVKVVKQPHRLYWWQWGQLLGVILPVLYFYLDVQHALLWALAFHFLMDFTTQSDETVLNKAQGNKQALIYHAFLAGGFAGFIVGGLAGLVISVMLHYNIDATNKFSLKNPLGPILDQAAHVFTLVFIWWLF
jgi:hypothetical protein